MSTESEKSSLKSTASTSDIDSFKSFKSHEEDVEDNFEMEDVSVLTQDSRALFFTPTSKSSKVGEEDSIFSFIDKLTKEIDNGAIVIKNGMALAVSGKPSSLALAVKRNKKSGKRKNDATTSVSGSVANSASIAENIDVILEEEDENKKLPAVEDASDDEVEPPLKRVSIALLQQEADEDTTDVANHYTEYKKM